MFLCEVLIPLLNFTYMQLRSMMLPDRYIDHGAPNDQIDEAGLSSKHILATVLSLLDMPKEALLFK